MSENLVEATVAEPEPRCPKCGQTLHVKGRIVDTGSFKKWVEEWRCPAHGAISPRRPGPDDASNPF